jgi:hypothetical protein
MLYGLVKQYHNGKEWIKSCNYNRSSGKSEVVMVSTYNDDVIDTEILESELYYNRIKNEHCYIVELKTMVSGKGKQLISKDVITHYVYANNPKQVREGLKGIIENYSVIDGIKRIVITKTNL